MGGFSVFMLEPLWPVLQRIKEQDGLARVLKRQLKVLAARTKMASPDPRRPQKTVLLQKLFETGNTNGILVLSVGQREDIETLQISIHIFEAVQ
jgi:hypothetical protein